MITMKISPKSSAIWLSLVFVGVLFTFGQKDQRGLEIPACVSEPSVNTHIHFYVSNTVLESYTKSVIEQDLNESLEIANKILANSCVAMTRSLAAIKYIDLTKQTFSNIGQSHKTLLNVVGNKEIDGIRAKPNHYYGLVMGKSDNYFRDINYDEPEFVGETNPSTNAHYFTLSADASLLTVEHELGHLAWAQHHENNGTLTRWLNQAYADQLDKVKPYARAYKCGDSGTIMSYEPNTLLAYSSPDMTYQGEACGDVNTADNARLLREYAAQLRQNLARHAINAESPQG